MELWIRSQDKTTLIRSYEIYIVEHKKSVYCIRAKRTSHILGAYSTIERALEVLDEIQQYLNNNCEFIERKTHTSMGTYIDKIEFYVYEMPNK